MELTRDELLIVFAAHRIGRVSYDGDGWYASGDGSPDFIVDYDRGEEIMQEAGDILARLSREILADAAPDAAPEPSGGPNRA